MYIEQRMNEEKIIDAIRQSTAQIVNATDGTIYYPCDQCGKVSTHYYCHPRIEKHYGDYKNRAHCGDHDLIFCSKKCLDLFKEKREKELQEDINKAAARRLIMARQTPHEATLQRKFNWQGKTIDTYEKFRAILALHPIRLGHVVILKEDVEIVNDQDGLYGNYGCYTTPDEPNKTQFITYSVCDAQYVLVCKCDCGEEFSISVKNFINNKSPIKGCASLVFLENPLLNDIARKVREEMNLADSLEGTTYPNPIIRKMRDSRARIAAGLRD